MWIVSQQLQTCNLLSPRLALSRFNLEKKSKRATDADTTVPSEATNSLKQLEHDNSFKEVSPSDFIALQYREELTQIGKVVKLNESSVSVEWLVGSYSGTFSFWKKRGRVICEIFLLRRTVSLETDSSYELTKADVCGLISAEFV